MFDSISGKKGLIFFILENWARECESKGRIALELSKILGQPVYLIPKNLANLIMPVLPGLYFHKSLQKHINYEVGELISKGGRYAVIDDEVIIRDIKLDHRYGLTPSLCSLIFANCREEYQDLIDRGFSNVQLTGNPRLLPSTSSLEGRSEKKPLENILFSSNFSMIRPAGTISVQRVIEDQGLDAPAAEKLKGFIEYHCLREFKIRDYLKILSENYNVTYRAHPLESYRSAVTAFDGSKVKVVKGGNITSDIRRNDLVLHAGCSVALDCQLIGKKSIWLYANAEEAMGDRSKLSHVFDGKPTRGQLQDLFSPTKNKCDPEVLNKMMGGVAHLTREGSTSLIAQALAGEATSMSRIYLKNVFKYLPKLALLYLLWIYRLIVDPVENERFDTKSTAELILFCSENGVKYKKYPGCILRIG